MAPGTLNVRSIVAVSKDQVSTELAGETAIVHVHSGVYYGLDGVGARVWALIQKPQPVGTIRDALVQEYDVNATDCERDLLRLLGELAEAQLIDVHDAPPS